MNDYILCANGHRITDNLQIARGMCARCGARILPPEPSASDEAATSDGDLGPDAPTAPTSNPRQPPPATMTSVQTFVIQSFIDRGAFGEVFRVTDRELGRTAALKRMQLQYPESSPIYQSFIAESRITASLEHPGIIPVHSIGFHEGNPFYTMRLLTTKTLAHEIRSHYTAGGTLSRDHLRRFIAICQAVHFAHNRGVIHRDIKPGNIGIGDFGEALLADWGLARRLDDPELQTDRGRGSPGYIAPEQGIGSVETQGAHCDTYSLGGVLLFILTGLNPWIGFADEKEPPVSAPRPAATSTRLPSGVPEMPPPKALLAIARKAMKERVKDRYATALALGQDVQRWLDDEPIAVFRDPPSVRALRWMRRHKTHVSIGASVLLVGIIAILISTLLVHQEQRRTAEQERLTRLQLAKSNIAEADALAAGGNPVESLLRLQSADKLLVSLSKSRDPAILAALDVIWHGGGPALSSADLGPRFRDAALSSGRNEALTVSDDGVLRTVDLLTAVVTPWPDSPVDFATAVAVSRDHIAVGTSDGHVWLLGSDHRPIWPAPFQPHRQAAIAVGFSPDGSRLASLGKDGSVWLWPSPPGSDGVVVLPAHEKATAISFAGNSDLVVAHAAGFYRIQLAPSSPAPALIKADHLTSIAASDSAAVVVAGDSHGVIHRWSSAGEDSFPFNLGQISRISIAPDTASAWIAAENGRCFLLDLSTGTILRTISPASGIRVMDVDWARNLAITVTRPAPSSILESWNLRGNPVATSLANSKGVRSPVAFSAAGSLLFALRPTNPIAGKPATDVAAWDLQSGLELLPRGTLPGGIALLSSDGKVALAATDSFLPAAGSDQEVTLLAVSDGHVLAHFKEQAGSSQFRVISRQGQSTVTMIASNRGEKSWTLALWDRTHAAPTCTLDLASSPTVGAFSNDGKFLAVGLENGHILLRDLAANASTLLGDDASTAVRQLSFVSSSDDLVTGHSDGTLHLFSPVQAAPKRTLPAAHRGAITSLLAPETGGLVFSSGIDGTLQIWTSDLDFIRAIQIPPATDLVAVDPTGDCLIFNGDGGLQAVHLSFARRIMEDDLKQSVGGHIAARYLALGRTDWCLQTLASGGAAGISHASLARAYWLEGRFADAASEFSLAAKEGPNDLEDINDCLSKIRSSK